MLIEIPPFGMATSYLTNSKWYSCYTTRSYACITVIVLFYFILIQ